MSGQNLENTQSSQARQWLKLFYVIPFLLMSVVLLGTFKGLLDVNAHDYVHYGLKTVALQTLIRQVNFALLIGLRLALPIVAILVGYQIYYKKFMPAFRATLGAVLLWVGTLLCVYLFIRREISDIDLHNLPDFIRRTLTIEGFFDRYFVQKIEIGQMLLLPITKPLTLLAALTIGLPFGVFFERVTRFGEKAIDPKKIGLGGKLIFWVGFGLCVILVLSLNGALAAVAGRSEMPRPNVLMISIDTLRQDALGAYGSKTARTPTLDYLAKNGAVFENVYTNSPWTLPSHATMLTGLTPTHLGIRKVQDRLSKKALTMPEVLKNYGYTTAAFTSYILVSPAYGFDQGFDLFNYNRDYTADDIVNMASAYIQTHREKPFFLFLHLFDPHWPYHPQLNIAREFFEGKADPGLIALHNEKDYYKWVVKTLKGPERFLEFSKQMYDAEVSYVDRTLERLFTTLLGTDQLDRTIIIVTSDHGEEFKEHDLMGHGLTLYDEVLRVPLIVRFPSIIPINTRIDMPVQLVDLFPTILSMVAIDSPIRYLEGRDISSEVFITGGASERKFLAETSMSGDIRYATVEQQHKYITPFELHFGDEITLHHDAELFDLKTDPGEHENLAEQKPTLLSHMKQSLADTLLEVETSQERHGSMRVGETKELTTEEIERLRSLGYIQ